MYRDMTDGAVATAEPLGGSENVFTPPAPHGRCVGAQSIPPFPPSWSHPRERVDRYIRVHMHTHTHTHTHMHTHMHTHTHTLTHTHTHTRIYIYIYIYIHIYT
jgi:hypothetical protein